MGVMKTLRKCQGTMNKKFITLALSLFAVAGAYAQGDDFGMDFSVGAEKKIRSGMEVSIEGNARTQDKTRKMDRWSIGAGFDMKIYDTSDFDIKATLKWEYMWVYKLNQIKNKYDEYTYTDPVLGSYTEQEYKGYNEELAYWRNRHRTSVGLTATYEPNKRWKFQLKETVQYSHYCNDSTTQNKYRLDGKGNHYFKESEMDYKGAKDRTILRSRITAQYDVRRCLLDPYVSVEYGCGLNYTANKWKFMVGTDIKINKQNVIDAFYRYQTEDDDEDPNGHIIGVGYKYKF